jgi:hypothetical protein
MALDPAYYSGHRHYRLRDMEAIIGQAGLKVSRDVSPGGIWKRPSMICLYIFKWVFRREMPVASFLEREEPQNMRRFNRSPA